MGGPRGGNAVRAARISTAREAGRRERGYTLPATGASGNAGDRNPFGLAYCSGMVGGTFTQGGNWRVGRAWGANTYHGAGWQAARARGYAPWVAEKYELLDLGLLGCGEAADDGGGYYTKRTVPRPRVIEQCISQWHPGAPRPPLVEVSYDSGTTWTQLDAGVRILRQQLGVHLEEADLRNLTDAAGQSLPLAYMRGTLRVRVTGAIRGDVAVDTGVLSSLRSVSQRPRGKLLVRRTSVRHDRRDAVGGGNSQFIGSGDLPPLEIDHRDAAAWDTQRYFAGNDRIRHAGNIEIPDLALRETVGAVDLGYQPGDQLGGIVAEDGHHEWDVPLLARESDEYPVIACVTYMHREGDEGVGQSTVLTLEDPQAPRLA